MKFSFMSFSTPELNFNQMLAVALQYGFQGVEPRMSSGHKHGIELEASKQDIKEFKLMSEVSGIEICCLATSCKFSDPETYAGNIETAKRTIELASEIGAPVIRVFGGGIPDGCPREKSFELIVESLGKLADIGESNVTVCMETHDSWCGAKMVADIMKAVGKPSIAVNWDIMHPALKAGYSMRDAFDALKPWIKHVHLHDGRITDGKLTLLPVGDGDVDHRTALTLLKESEYTGYSSGEWINWEPFEIHLPREMNTLKSYL